MILWFFIKLSRTKNANLSLSPPNNVYIMFKQLAHSGLEGEFQVYFVNAVICLPSGAHKGKFETYYPDNPFERGIHNEFK